MCRLLIRKFPVLQDSLGNGIVRFTYYLLKIDTCFFRARGNSSYDSGFLKKEGPQNARSVTRLLWKQTKKMRKVTVMYHVHAHIQL